MLRFLTSGESHGPGLTAIIEGLPAGLPLSADEINVHLRRRQGGYGRGGRMKIEKDQVIIRSGVRHGQTLGSPVTLEINNRDWENWQVKMSITPVEEEIEPISLARPGHADFTGLLKYGHRDIRNVIERSSARETASRVLIGSVCGLFLKQFGIEIHSHVLSIGSVGDRNDERSAVRQHYTSDYWESVEASPVRCGDSALGEQMVAFIQDCKTRADTCGGVFEVVATGLPIGLGSFSMWDRRLSARIASAMMSIPSAKGVEIGDGFQSTVRSGSHVHDVIRNGENGEWQRITNNAGGIEGGISNGEPIVVRVGVKPIASLAHPLPTVDLLSGENVPEGRYERSDVCIVPAGGVVGETMLAITLAEAWTEKFGGDSVDEIRSNVDSYIARTLPQ